MDEGFKERVKKFANSQGLSVKALQDKLGLSNAHFANTTSVSPKVGAKIRDAFPGANIDWLNYGTGEMFVANREQSASTIVPLVPISASAGRLTEFTAQIMDYDCEKVVSPVRDVQLAIRVDGDSMSPEYPNGSIVFVSQIDENAFIEWGKTFVLDTVNGIVIKRVLPCPNEEDSVLCRSVNPNYSDFVVRRDNIYHWFIVRAQVSTK